MSFENIPDRTTDDYATHTDINQLSENIRVLSGNGIDAPTINLKILNEITKIKSIDTLLIKPNTTYPYYKVDISFQGLRVDLTYISSVSTTIDITINLDTGAEAVSTWYYIWIFTKADGSYTFKFSTSYNSPAVPSGYIYKRLIGVVRNDGSGNFVNFYQNDKRIMIEPTTVLSAGTASAKTILDISGYVPNLIIDSIFGNALSGVAAKTLYISPANNTLGEQRIYSASTIQCYFELAILSGNIYYYSTATGSATLIVSGYILNI